MQKQSNSLITFETQLTTAQKMDLFITINVKILKKGRTQFISISVS